MSLSSIIGAVSSAVHQVSDAAESAALSVVQPAAQAIHDAATPAVTGLLQQVASHPQWFGSEAASGASFLSTLWSAEPTGNPLWLPEPLRDLVQTAVR